MHMYCNACFVSVLASELEPWEKSHRKLNVRLDHMIDRVLFVVDFRASDELLMREMRRLNKRRRIVVSD